MARLKSGEWLAPFWGKKGYSTGRDPLGMQIASIGTYAILLPGLTNLTRRIRYYSYFCWVVERYARDETHTDAIVFRQFIRRAELLYAFGMAICFPDSPAVVGKDWADSHIKDFEDNLPDDHIIDIAGGADQNGERTYWKYNLGAFGQYFLGSLFNIGLIREREGNPGVYLCTDKGRQLGDSFAKTLNSQTISQIIEAVKNGKIDVKSMRAIQPQISLDGIVPESEEWKILLELLLGPDDGGRTQTSTYFRKSTLMDYLKFRLNHRDFDYSEFSRVNYESVLKVSFKNVSAVQQGWFIYELNEIAHFSMGAVLWGLLETLAAKGYAVPYKELEADLTEGTLVRMIEECHGKITRSSSVKNLVEFLIEEQLSEEKLENKINEAIESEQNIAAICSGIFLSLILYRRVIPDRIEIEAYSLARGMARDGDVSDLIGFLFANQDRPLSDMISILIRRNIVNRHIEEAVRKMGGGIRNTLKFRQDDGKLFHIQTVTPQWTQPRLLSLHQFLVDLKVLDTQGQLTSQGEAILKGSD